MLRARVSRRLKDRRGFTLIELMMVVAVIIILAAVLIPRIGAARKEAKYTGVLQNLNTVHGVVEAMIDKGKYQSAQNAVSNLQTDLVSKLTGLDPKLFNPYSTNDNVINSLPDQNNSQPAVAVVTESPAQGPDVNYAGSVVAYIHRAGTPEQTIVDLYPYDGSGNRIDTDGRTVKP